MNTLYENTESLEKQISFVSHEIRNNISICDMYSQIIKRKLENTSIKDDSIENALNCIQNSIQLISANLEDLKSLTPEKTTVCNINKIIKKAIELSKAYIEDKKIEYDYIQEENIFACADKNRLSSCIVNILKNAIEAIETEGNIKILLKKIPDFAVITIKNNGEQIPSNMQDKIFNYGCTTKERGSGFGLCICKKYIENQNGQFNLLKSDENETVFEIKLPA